MSAGATRERRSRAPMFALLGANAISMTGNMAALVAIPWFVLETTGSPARTGITAFAALLPNVLSATFGGALVDRLGYRRASIVADLASAGAVAAIPLLHSTVGLQFWQLVVLVFLGGLLDAPGATARGALIPDVSGRAGWTLERASGASAVVERGARLAGAPLAGLLIVATAPTNVLWIDAATFVVSAIAVAVWVPRPANRLREARTSYVAELRAGYAFLRHEPTLATLVGMLSITNLLDSVAFVALPVYAERVYASPIALGLMIAAQGAGSVIGALAFATVGDRVSRRRVFGWGFVVSASWYPVAVLFPPLAVMIAAKTISGVASGPLNPVIDTVFFERVPDGMRARVLGVTHAAAWVGVPLGVLIGGGVIEAVGLRPTLLAVGTLYLAVTLGTMALPSLRRLDERRARVRLAA
jgi:MFS family permease